MADSAIRAVSRTDPVSWVVDAVVEVARGREGAAAVYAARLIAWDWKVRGKGQPEPRLVLVLVLVLVASGAFRWLRGLGGDVVVSVREVLALIGALLCGGGWARFVRVKEGRT